MLHYQPHPHSFHGTLKVGLTENRVHQRNINSQIDYSQFTVKLAIFGDITYFQTLLGISPIFRHTKISLWMVVYPRKT